jgi:hypothetical protein
MRVHGGGRKMPFQYFLYLGIDFSCTELKRANKKSRSIFEMINFWRKDRKKFETNQSSSAFFGSFVN